MSNLAHSHYLPTGVFRLEALSPFPSTQRRHSCSPAEHKEGEQAAATDPLTGEEKSLSPSFTVLSTVCLRRGTRFGPYRAKVTPSSVSSDEPSALKVWENSY